MTLSIDLPATPLARAALAAAQTSESTSVANHSIRSFLFAELLAGHEGALNDAAYDRDLLFAACVMHDLGTGAEAPGKQRFEVEGADLAAEILTEHGVAVGDVDRVWEAIALHSSPGIAERRGLLAYLTTEGIGIDFGHKADIVMSQERLIHSRYPRLDMVKSLTSSIVAHATLSTAAAPRYSLPGELARERRERGVSNMEIAASSSVWGS
ncbi:HD domain-containing protein [Cryobacterium sp. HLT2-28]|uniref:HD domain-containing protein n=1 Tax=Cryobacterium sp. HLT2-28 TaxID=1259146 RepID=UPI00106A2694|nr:HD domain-containing protein [Cryobacterium sp. HLT2-28]TFB98147.1 HD domain-containing protein [Cryobacterium sp. HLT2-28]